jgi:uncharacterized protein (DUF1330 family)
VEVINAVQPQPEQARAFFTAQDQSPFVMVNLLKFKDKATYAPGTGPDGADAMTGAQAYWLYAAAVAKLVVAHGGRIVHSGAVTGLLLGQVEDLWDMVALAEYPSPAAMFAMATSPEYAAIAHHREAGLAGQLNIQTRPVAA